MAKIDDVKKLQADIAAKEAEVKRLSEERSKAEQMKRVAEKQVAAMKDQLIKLMS